MSDGNPGINVEISKELNLDLIKLASYLEAEGKKEIEISMISYGGCNFEINGTHIDGISIFDDSPFRGGVNLGQFINSIFSKMEDDFLNESVGDESQELILKLSKDDDGEWKLYETYSDTVENNSEESYEYDEEHNEENKAFGAIIKMMKDHNINTLKYSFSGGGDSGSLDELEAYRNIAPHETELKSDADGGAENNTENDSRQDFEDGFQVERFNQQELIEIDFEKIEISIDEIGTMVSAASLISDHADSMTDNIGDWYNNEGGCGIAYISDDGTSGVDATYYGYEMEEMHKDTPIELAIPIKFANTQEITLKKSKAKKIEPESMEP